MSEPDPDELLPTGAAAALLGIDPRTLRRWADNGHVAYTTLGPAKLRRFRRGDLATLTVTINLPEQEPTP